MSTTTNTAQPQRVGALLPMPSCLGIGGTPVGPGKDTHGTLGPEQRGGSGWPTPTLQLAKSRCNDASTRQSNTQDFRETWQRSGEHQHQVTITNTRDDQPAGAEDCRGTAGEVREDDAVDPASDGPERNDRAAERGCNQEHSTELSVVTNYLAKLYDK